MIEMRMRASIPKRCEPYPRVRVFDEVGTTYERGKSPSLRHHRAKFYISDNFSIISSTHFMQAFLQEFFSNLGITITSLEVKEEWEDISVRIETPDSPLLIGVHGKNIESFQHIIGRLAEKKLGRFIRIHLEVNDYMKAKDERLYAFLDGKIAWVRESGKSFQIKNLSSFERKKAHSHISDQKIEWLSTKSEWEWDARMIVLTYSGTLNSSVSPKPIPHIAKTNAHTPDRANLSEDGVGI